jgi:hypothetical protein
MAETHSGACLCGAVRYEVNGPLRDVIACHCTQCRKQSGHYYATTSAADETLTVEGGGFVTWYEASENARRGFCSVCGSALFWKPVARDVTSILAGSLDKPTGIRMSKHIFCADKGDYYDIGDGLPQE